MVCLFVCLFVFQLEVVVSCVKKWSQGLEAGTCYQELMQRPWRDTTRWLASHVWLSYLFFPNIYLFYVCEYTVYTVAVFRHARRGHQITL